MTRFWAACKIHLQTVTITTTMLKSSDSEAHVSSAFEPNVNWPAILAEHDRWLRTVVYARLREADAVEDVMQEVALAAVRQASPIQDMAKVAPWLYRLAIRQTLLYRRKCGRRRRLHQRYADRVQPVDNDYRTPDPLDWMLTAERCRMVRQALEQLAQRDSEILLLKYTEGWSYHQIADHLGISHSAVEARLHRARKRLRAELMAIELVEVK
jgi:RNA polymerase sigma factor (sigma-70 family)